MAGIVMGSGNRLVNDANLVLPLKSCNVVESRLTITTTKKDEIMTEKRVKSAEFSKFCYH